MKQLFATIAIYIYMLYRLVEMRTDNQMTIIITILLCLMTTVIINR